MPRRDRYAKPPPTPESCPCCGRPYAPLSDLDLLVWSAIKSAEGCVTPGYQDIADMIDVSVSSVHKTVRVLEAQGLVTRYANGRCTRALRAIRPPREHK